MNTGLAPDERGARSPSGNDEGGLEALCTRAGAGELAVDGRPLPQQRARALPASD